MRRSALILRCRRQHEDQRPARRGDIVRRVRRQRAGLDQPRAPRRFLGLATARAGWPAAGRDAAALNGAAGPGEKSRPGAARRVQGSGPRNGATHHQTEPEVVVAEVGRVPEAVRGAAVVGGVAPRAAAHDPASRTLRLRAG